MQWILRCLKKNLQLRKHMIEKAQLLKYYSERLLKLQEKMEDPTSNEDENLRSLDALADCIDVVWLSTV